MKNGLTPREIDVLRLLASGHSYWQAAARLGISPHTVVSHVKNAYRKLDVHTAASAVMRAVERGFFSPPMIRGASPEEPAPEPAALSEK